MNLCVLLLCQQCPAIDYTRHTLDGAACLLNSNKYFPSRLVSKLLFYFIKSVELRYGKALQHT